VQPAFDGPAWFGGYAERTAGDGIEGRLVSQHSFTEHWAEWEVHPHGAEVIICVTGQLRLIQQYPDGREVSMDLRPGEYAINPAGVWHTADVDTGTETTCIFITSGLETGHRPRD